MTFIQLSRSVIASMHDKTSACFGSVYWSNSKFSITSKYDAMATDQQTPANKTTKDGTILLSKIDIHIGVLVKSVSEHFTDSFCNFPNHSWLHIHQSKEIEPFFLVKSYEKSCSQHTKLPCSCPGGLQSCPSWFPTAVGQKTSRIVECFF